MNKYLISIVGPTAIGKTALGIQLAQHYVTEIISADSRQFFKEMSIGTAVPTTEELSSVRHHFIHHKSIHDHYNVGMFEKDAINKLHDLFKTNDVVIMVGGSGLYIDVIANGLDNFPEVDPSIRESLNLKLKKEGIKTLQDQLKHLDPNSYHTIAIDNPHRLIRALEICIGTDQPYSSFINKKVAERPFKTIYVGLSADRTLIYERINMRVDSMIDSGLLEEVKNLYDYKSLNALNTVGYKELFNYLDNEWTLEFAISEIKKNTRRFAKRQLTWFKKNEDIIWFDYETPLDKITRRLNQEIKNPM